MSILQQRLLVMGLATALATGQLQRFPSGPLGSTRSGPTVHSSYIGMSWRDHREDPRAKGVHSRLASHASGRRSGDQFNVYICDHFVIPDLAHDQLQDLRDGKRILDQLTKGYIRTHLEFSVWIAPGGQTARDVEHELRAIGLPEFGRPLLNPR